MEAAVIFSRERAGILTFSVDEGRLWGILEAILRSCGPGMVFECTRLLLRCEANHFSVLPLYGLLCTYIVTNYPKQAVSKYSFRCCALPTMLKPLFSPGVIRLLAINVAIRKMYPGTLFSFLRPSLLVFSDSCPLFLQ